MTTFEQIVGTSTLDVVVPNTSLGFPTADVDQQQWLRRLSAGDVERKLAFFDEHLDFLLVLRLAAPETTLSDPSMAPLSLLSFLAHTQISYDATYISPMPLSPAPTPRVGTPPRTVSLKPRGHVPPSIVPPSTPNPMPSVTEQDKRYVRAEGTTLATGVWGEDKGETSEGRDAFALLWDAEKKMWTAVFRMCVSVAFLRLQVRDPLLCLTVSATLRERPVPVTAAREPLVKLIAAVGGLPKSPTDPTDPSSSDDDEEDDRFYNGLAEVNLLAGLTAAPSLSNAAASLSLPTTRLGPKTRRREFSLRPTAARDARPHHEAETPTTANMSGARNTLRKSFRKTLQTVSGFRVRMRTVFVPYVLLPLADPDALDALEAGHTERTVVLCIELENAGESGGGFAIEDIEVSVGGDGGARVRLIRWGDEAASNEKVFPLRIGVLEQYNLLYAVELLNLPMQNKDDLLLGAADASLPESELQRTVTINVHGRPFVVPHTGSSGLVHHEDGFTDARAKAREQEQERALVFPTPTFVSRWNCILDLSPQRNRDSLTVPLRVDSARSGPASANLAARGGVSQPSAGLGEREVLPEPASPFPTATPRTAVSFAAQQIPKSASAQISNPVAGSKRFTAPPGAGVPLSPKFLNTNFRASTSTSLLNPANIRESSPSLATGAGAGPSPLSKLAYTPPSLAAQTYARPPGTPTTTFAPPPPLTPHGFGFAAIGNGIPPPAPLSPMLPTAPGDEQFALDAPPMTPAYPAYPHSPGPLTPRGQAPLAGWGGAVGPAVELPRSRAPGVLSASAGSSVRTAFGSPSTPTPHLGAGRADDDGDAALPDAEKIIVSVGLLPGADAAVGQPKIHPHDRFTLDIFVFNQSAWTRRLEVGCRERRRRRHGLKGPVGPGIIPLENRVRVGPLRPSTCQSVRMEFLALVPGVHAIDTLTLTDVETGYSMNLRSVMDVVVHEVVQAA